MKACLFLLIFAASYSLPAQDLYCLGRIELAGIPPSSPPRLGDSLQLNPETLQLVRADGTPAGFLPAVYRSPIVTMASRGVELRFEVVVLHTTPAPGRFLMVEIWALPTSPHDLEFLVYRVPHPESLPEDS